MEASGHARWFERWLAERNCELWIGDATEIARKRECKQKADRQDAQHILRLLLKDDFAQIWVPKNTWFSPICHSGTRAKAKQEESAARAAMRPARTRGQRSLLLKPLLLPMFQASM
jgi:hypothetical protein